MSADLSSAPVPAPAPSAQPESAFSVCPYCEGKFRPVVARQRFCTEPHRRAFHSKKGDGGIRGVVSTRRILKRGEISITLRFGIESRDRALKLSDAGVMEVVES